MRRMSVSLVVVVVALGVSGSSSGRDAASGILVRTTVVTGEVAYTRIRGGHSWITVADLVGKGRREITSDPRRAAWNDHSPAWSPDGSRLAFIREGRSGSGLYVANRDGTGLRRLVHLPKVADSDPTLPVYDASDFSWSPDGQRLAFADGPLVVVDADGTGTRTVVPTRACKPSWSPDGGSLVYLVDDGCSSERGANAADPGYQAVSRVDVDGTHRRELARGSVGDAAWSPDGRLIAFTNACEVRHGGDWLCAGSVMNADGSGRHRVTPRVYSGGEWAVAWAAGGQQLLWSDYPAFYATTLADGRPRKVIPLPYKEGSLVGISLDGRRLAILARSRYDMNDSPHPIPPLVITTLDRSLILRVTVPRGWEAIDASVTLR